MYFKLTVICFFLWCSCAAFIAGANAIPPLVKQSDLGYAFILKWRFGAPTFISEEFPNPRPNQNSPLLYTPEMTPRGLLVLDSPGGDKSTTDDAKLVLRSKMVDITSLLTIVGASHHSDDDKITNYNAEQLPPLKVVYDPDLSMEIIMPKSKSCVLLWQLGDGKEGEWREGYWRVVLRFDARSLTRSLLPNGLGGIRDPAFGQRDDVVIFPFDFRVKKIQSYDEQLNYYLFKSKDDTAKGDYPAALTSLNAILDKYPNDGPTLLARSRLYERRLKNLSAAIKDAQQLLSYAENNQLRRPFTPLTLHQGSSPTESIDWLKGHIESLQRRLNATIPAK